MLIIIAVMAVFISLANRQERASSLPQQKTALERRQSDIEKFIRNKSALPQVDYAAAESQMQTQSEVRKARAKRYNAGGTALANERETTTEITGEEETLVPLPALPVEQSNVVVAGTITDAKGYLSEDKSGAYSEYSVNVTEVFKGAAKLTGSQIIAERLGAKVVLPKGRTILYWDTSHGTPEIGHRYVLFLKYDPKGDDYLIITGYELINGRVRSLDRDETFTAFDDNEETAFLDLVRSSAK
jgi:hypothetical protein